MNADHEGALPEEALRMLGLAIRSHQVSLGQDRVERMLRGGRVAGVWIARDLARNAAYKVRRACERAGVPCWSAGTSADLGARTGRDGVKVYILHRGRLGERVMDLLARDQADSEAE